jgi:WD40 repeat protein
VITQEDAKTGQVISTQTQKSEIGDQSDRDLLLWNANGRPQVTAAYSGIVTSLAFDASGQMIATGGGDTTVRLWSVRSGEILTTMQTNGGIVNSVAWARSKPLLASGGRDGTVTLWSVTEKEELVKLVSWDKDQWIAIAPDGRFDTNNLEEIKGLQWTFSDDPFRPLAPEIYMRYYYEPRLLPRLLRNDPFTPVPPLASLNRAQPAVAIERIE